MALGSVSAKGWMESCHPPLPPLLGYIITSGLQPQLLLEKQKAL